MEAVNAEYNNYNYKIKIMKVLSLNHIKKSEPIPVMDCSVGRGYWKVAHGSLPD